jgi:hypothetical protein
MQALYTTTRREDLMATVVENRAQGRRPKTPRYINYSFVFLNSMNFILLNRSVVVMLPSHVARLQNIRQTTEQGEEQELLYENMVSAMKGTVGRRFHRRFHRF